VLVCVCGCVGGGVNLMGQRMSGGTIVRIRFV